jgi:hypothetical protein
MQRNLRFFWCRHSLLLYVTRKNTGLRPGMTGGGIVNIMEKMPKESKQHHAVLKFKESLPKEVIY